MGLLFDVAPEEPTRRKRNATRMQTAPVEPVVTLIKREVSAAIRPLGRLDHTHECVDDRCRGSAHDIIHEDRGEWMIQCCFCHTCQWVPVIAGHLTPRPEAFTFRDGRFAGLTIDEAVEQPHGREYVAWAAQEHKRDAVRKACQTWLDSAVAAR